jgi:hypothetical protein
LLAPLSGAVDGIDGADDMFMLAVRQIQEFKGLFSFSVLCCVVLCCVVLCCVVLCCVVLCCVVLCCVVFFVVFHACILLCGHLDCILFLPLQPSQPHLLILTAGALLLK